MAKKRKLTPLQVMYKKEVDRIKRAVKRAEKKGYIFEEDVIPKIPKRVTKQAVERVKKYKTPDIYKKAQKLDYETGELTKGTVARKQERSEASKKGWEERKRKERTIIDFAPIPINSDIIIYNFKYDVNRFPQSSAPMLLQWVDNMIARYGKDGVAEMLEESKATGVWISPQIAYDYNLILNMIADMLQFLPDTTDQFRSDLMEAIQDGEYWEEP